MCTDTMPRFPQGRASASRVNSSTDSSPASHTRRQLLKLGACAAAFTPVLGFAQQTEVALAGLAFSGDAASLAQRFPYSVAYEKALKAGGKPAFAMLRDAIAQNPPQQLKLVTQIDELKGRDQAIAVALVIGSETISVEQLAGLHKLFVLIRAQALFFDFKTMSIVRSYPISFGHIDIFDRPPNADEIRVRPFLFPTVVPSPFWCFLCGDTRARLSQLPRMG